MEAVALLQRLVHDERIARHSERPFPLDDQVFQRMFVWVGARYRRIGIKRLDIFQQNAAFLERGAAGDFHKRKRSRALGQFQEARIARLGYVDDTERDPVAQPFQ